MTSISRHLHRSAAWLAGAAALFTASAALAQPANNNCANAINIGNTTVSGTTIGASNDYSGSICGASGSSPDVWYRYTASATTTITATMCGGGTGFDCVLSIHPACGAQSTFCNDDSCGLQSLIAFPAVNGTAYFVRVSGYNGATGTFEMSIGPGGGGQPPSNDGCASATAIGNGSFNGTTNNATDDGDSTCAGSSTPDVYYLYTAPTTGSVTASTCAGGSFDTVISVHSACPASPVNQIACNDNFCGTRSQSTFQAVSGTQYIIRVAGSAASGTFTLSMGEPPPPGPNGPDVTHQSINGIASFGAVGGVRASA